MCIQPWHGNASDYPVQMMPGMIVVGHPVTGYTAIYDSLSGNVNCT